MPISHPEIKDEDIVADRLNGMTFRQLSEKYNIGLKSIQYRLDRAGVQRKFAEPTKISKCVECGSFFEQGKWERRDYCSPKCKKQRNYDRTKEERYPWGSYIVEALRGILIDTIKRSETQRIPLNRILEHIRHESGFPLHDEELYRAITHIMEELGYRYKNRLYLKRKR